MTIIKTLTAEESLEMLSLIQSMDELWGPHEKFGGIPLTGPNGYKKEFAGETIWVHFRSDNDWISYDLESMTRMHNILESYKNMIDPLAKFGRVYIHRLKPGKLVTPHVDGRYDPEYFSRVNRYQIYFDIPDACIINSASKIASNSVVWFDHASLHSYSNDSDKDLTFIVFDLLDCTVKNNKRVVQ